ncbi:MAG: radical SAM protein [Thaumarchaeota archaeon]|nr:radical SAM protein [Candidatus Geocrenenecus arthurdayi]MCL7391684.1 radical SAM protein [Candidatus Geocrenenecus arthurdayi]MCL7404011.1 radical SAM protein [Candidatus Geocrenenecus arthurdayi]
MRYSRRVLPLYIPPTLMVKQAASLMTFKYATRWSGFGRWVKDISVLLKISAGAIGIGCFGYPIHPVFEVTSNCNLRCLHCHARGGEFRLDELDTKNAKKVIESLADVREFRTLVFTGGEPLVRRDIFQLMEYASNIGFYTILATNATLITREVARKLKEVKIGGIAASIDFVDPVMHDEYRGASGAFEKTLKGILNAQREGLYIQINITISKRNINQLRELTILADKIGAHVILLYQLIPSGRGENLFDETLDSEYFRILIEKLRNIQSGINPVTVPVGLPEYFAYLTKSIGLNPKIASHVFRGCIAGRGMYYIKPNGDVWPCPFLPIPAGNLKEKSAKEIWRSSVFNMFRDRSRLKGQCSRCIYREVCGGCRARAYAYTRDPLESDPCCPLYKVEKPITSVQKI